MGPVLRLGVHTTMSRAEGGESALSVLDTNRSLEFIQVSQSHLTDKKTETQKSRFAQGHTAWEKPRRQDWKLVSGHPVQGLFHRSLCDL